MHVNTIFHTNSLPLFSNTSKRMFDENTNASLTRMKTCPFALIRGSVRHHQSMTTFSVSFKESWKKSISHPNQTHTRVSHKTHLFKFDDSNLHWNSFSVFVFCFLIFAGMGKEVENLITENTELLATKYARQLNWIRAAIFVIHYSSVFLFSLGMRWILWKTIWL